jgi:hypothetical protein
MDDSHTVMVIYSARSRNGISKKVFEKFHKSIAAGALLLLLQFLPILLGNQHDFLHVKLIVVAVGLHYGLLEVDMLAHALEVRKDFAVLSHCDVLPTRNNQREGEGIGVPGAVIC